MDKTLDVLLDGTTEPRIKLASHDEARALMALLAVLDTDEQPDDVRLAAGEMRFRIGSRIIAPTRSA
ncbi:hypothetical protein [Streptomyces sp. NRRL S-237]|uniref:hypothetical protein n=1 Tax=Streptomyces sp. NRRL S-237 TaxID=1463895 RepID=UPI0004CC0372|nr:hypothetical protein [Streptomyces sp. NRRL S-237]